MNLTSPSALWSGTGAPRGALSPRFAAFRSSNWHIFRQRFNDAWPIFNALRRIVSVLRIIRSEQLSHHAAIFSCSAPRRACRPGPCDCVSVDAHFIFIHVASAHSQSLGKGVPLMS